MKKVLSVVLSAMMLLSIFAIPASAYAAGVGQVKSVKVVSTSSTSVKLKWKKINNATGYQVYCSTKKSKGYNKVKTVKTGKAVTAKIKKLKPNKKYYFKVRAVKKSKKGKFSKVVAAKTKDGLIWKKIVDNKKYKYDINRDGKKETIVTKTVIQRGENNYYGETIRNIYINGKKTAFTNYNGDKDYNISGYDHSDLYILKNSKSCVILNHITGGQGGTCVSYYYFNGKKYIEKFLWDETRSNTGYYFETPKISGKYLEIHASPKYHWFTTFEGLKCFDKEWDFDVMQHFVLSNGKLVNKSKYPSASPSKKYTSYSDFKTGKTMESIDKGEGPEVNIGDIISIVNIVQNGEDYYYRIKKGKSYGWFKGSSNIYLYQFEG